MVRVQEVAAGASGVRSYTVLGDDHRPIRPVDAHLMHLTDLNYSPNTVRAYAYDLADLFRWVSLRGRDWRRLALDEIGEWVSWLRLPPPARSGAVLALPSVAQAVSERSLQRKLAAVDSFYTFHARRDPSIELTLTRWSGGTTHRGKFKPFLVHTQQGARRREIRLRGVVDRHPMLLTRAEVTALQAACTRLRDRFLLTVLFETGIRAGEVLGLRHCDLRMAKSEVAVEPRLNANDARVKQWRPRTVPVNGQLFTLYADYMDGEYGAVDSDYVFVNLWRGRRGHAMTYDSLRSIVLRLRRDTGLRTFTPHQLRHTYATELIRRGTDWQVVQTLLGHASVQTTLNTYGHLSTQDARDALVAAGWIES